MAAARSPKSKAKKPSKKSVTQKKKHRKSKQRQYEKNRARDYRPRLRLPPGSYMILPVVKKEPILKKEPDPLWKTRMWRSQLSSRRSPESFKRSSPWRTHQAMARLSAYGTYVCVGFAPDVATILHWTYFRSVFSALPRRHRGTPIRGAVATAVPLKRFRVLEAWLSCVHRRTQVSKSQISFQ